MLENVGTGVEMRVLRALMCASVLGIGLTVGAMSIASASTVSRSNTCGDVGCVAPIKSTQPRSGVQLSGGTQSAAPTTPSTAAGGSLAFTGADIAEATILGLIAIGGGSALVLASRRSHRRNSNAV